MCFCIHYIHIQVHPRLHKLIQNAYATDIYTYMQVLSLLCAYLHNKMLSFASSYIFMKSMLSNTCVHMHLCPAQTLSSKT